MPPVVHLPQRVDFTPDPLGFVKADKDGIVTLSNFHFDIINANVPNLNGDFVMGFRLFVEADARTKFNRKGTVAIELSLDGKKINVGPPKRPTNILKATYDPLEFPPQPAIFFDSGDDHDSTAKVNNLLVGHNLSVKAVSNTNINYVRIHLIIHTVEP